MICHRRQFIFIHIGKNGGQSVEKALRPFAFSIPQRIIRYVDIRTGKRDPLGITAAGSHPSVADLKRVLGEETFDAYYTFCFVRNPWSRLLSFYKFAKLRPNSIHHKDVTSLKFDDFVDKYSEEPPMRSQSSLIVGSDGRTLVDFVGRFENIHQDFRTVCQTLRCSADLPHKNKTAKSDFRSAYSQRSIDTVAKLYADDIKTFDYRFE